MQPEPGQVWRSRWTDLPWTVIEVTAGVVFFEHGARRLRMKLESFPTHYRPPEKNT